MTRIPYNKPHASATDRVAHLIGRGLIVADPAAAEQEIDLIGYERLRIYFISRRQIRLPSRPFIAGTTYEEIIALYQCDAQLRDLVFGTVGRFEILLRNALSEVLSDRYSGHPYFTADAFKDTISNMVALKMFSEICGKSKDERAKHYFRTYSEPALPPIWTVKEFLTFGEASRLFPLLSSSVRTDIAAAFGVASHETFANWVECLVDIRNICAHHGRLFNRSFQKQPSTYRRGGVPTAQRNKLKAVLECLDYMMSQRGAGEGITAQVASTINLFPAMRPADAGY